MLTFSTARGGVHLATNDVDSIKTMTMILLQVLLQKAKHSKNCKFAPQSYPMAILRSSLSCSSQ